MHNTKLINANSNAASIIIKPIPIILVTQPTSKFIPQ
jgi:hypothetical protein